MKLINLTAHTVRIFNGPEVSLEVEPDKPMARIVEIVEHEKKLDIAGHAIPVATIRYGNTQGLPEPCEGVAYIVSRITAAACVGRTDVFFPLEEVRGDSGQIIGCRALGQFG